MDDAHAVGVIGAAGAGTASHYHLEGCVDLQVGTLSKSLASVGGYVAADEAIITYLQNKSRPFIFSTFLSPGDIAAAQTALAILRQEGSAYLQRLRSNTAYVRESLNAAGLPVIPGETPIIPLVVGDAAKATAIDFALRERGILISAIRPPTVAPGASRLRLTVTADHTREQLDTMLHGMLQVWR